MKRLPQTLTAAALTGALAFGGAAVAQAQEDKIEDKPVAEMPNGDSNAEGIPDPESVTLDGVEYFKDGDTYKSRPEFGAPVELSKEQALAARDKQAEELTADQPEEAPAGEQVTDAEGDEGNEGVPAPATKKDAEGNEWYQSLKDPAVYVNDPAKVNEEITDEMREAYAKAFPSEAPEKPEFDKKKLAWLALPAALVIGGITWYLSQDGKTYVKDEARKGQEPTAEEKAASEQMLNANKDEVLAQGGKLAEGDAAQAGAPAAPAAGEGTASVRGMAAETGSNSVAQALAALAVAAMVAAGAFAARRKFFA
ncbi:hypothetical protein QP324_02355 [Corynebacterium sp. UMB0012]|uniref:hypothetical protein n=1 Tax=unclassified Corynebacterium TaxID=2624378 RepID=UPI001EF5097C|nr:MULTISPECIES: hypothetical protein [unclassified Corynebacterium]MCG7445196.1 hypothetical protein [Corynebacterium sp. ACRPO]MDK7047416.1 hypothetical protein [Corynebacterium sp. UMB0012]